MKTALLAGATGLVGQQLLPLLAQSSYYSGITCIVRTVPNYVHPKIRYAKVDFDLLESLDSSFSADDIFCCLGTTMKKARSKEAFRKVDYDYPLALARQTYELGSQSYLLVSSLGASATSLWFYNRTKGEIEEKIRAIGFPSFHVFRPSLLLGERSESRPFEYFSKFFFSFLSPVMPLKYRPVPASKLASSMMAMAQRDVQGNFIHESNTLQR